jgi:ketosteroid isomerase-like protein
MPSEAAAVVRASIDAFNRRDMPALLECVDPNVEWVPLRAVLDGDVYRGHEGIQRFIVDSDEDMENMQVREDELLEVGDKFVVYGALVGRGRGSGMDLELPLGWVIGLHDGRIDYLRAYTDRAAALEAARAAREGVEQPFEPPARALDS